MRKQLDNQGLSEAPGEAGGAVTPGDFILLSVPGRLPSWNDLWGQTRWKRDQLTKDWATRVLVAASQAGVQGMMLTACEIEAKRWGVNQLDVDNVVLKPVIDGLKTARVIVDDDCSVVRRLIIMPSGKCPRQAARVELVIYLL